MKEKIESLVKKIERGVSDDGSVSLTSEEWAFVKERLEIFKRPVGIMLHDYHGFKVTWTDRPKYGGIDQETPVYIERKFNP